MRRFLSFIGLFVSLSATIGDENDELIGSFGEERISDEQIFENQLLARNAIERAIKFYPKFRDLALKLMKAFPDAVYVGIGRSPTPLMAFLECVAPKQVIQIPLSLGTVKEKTVEQLSPIVLPHLTKFVTSPERLHGKQVVLIDRIHTGATLPKAVGLIKLFFKGIQIKPKLVGFFFGATGVAKNLRGLDLDYLFEPIDLSTTRAYRFDHAPSLPPKKQLGFDLVAKWSPFIPGVTDPDEVVLEPVYGKLIRETWHLVIQDPHSELQKIVKGRLPQTLYEEQLETLNRSWLAEPSLSKILKRVPKSPRIDGKILIDRVARSQAVLDFAQMRMEAFLRQSPSFAATQTVVEALIRHGYRARLKPVGNYLPLLKYYRIKSKGLDFESILGAYRRTVQLIRRCTVASAIPTKEVSTEIGRWLSVSSRVPVSPKITGYALLDALLSSADQSDLRYFSWTVNRSFSSEKCTQLYGLALHQSPNLLPSLQDDFFRHVLSLSRTQLIALKMPVADGPSITGIDVLDYLLGQTDEKSMSVFRQSLSQNFSPREQLEHLNRARFELQNSAWTTALDRWIWELFKAHPEQAKWAASQSGLWNDVKVYFGRGDACRKRLADEGKRFAAKK